MQRVNPSPATKNINLKMLSAAHKCLCQGLISAYRQTNN